jgi:hypothetical protein
MIPVKGGPLHEKIHHTEKRITTRLPYHCYTEYRNNWNDFSGAILKMIESRLVQDRMLFISVRAIHSFKRVTV